MINAPLGFTPMTRVLGELLRRTRPKAVRESFFREWPDLESVQSSFLIHSGPYHDAGDRELGIIACWLETALCAGQIQARAYREGTDVPEPIPSDFWDPSDPRLPFPEGCLAKPGDPRSGMFFSDDDAKIVSDGFDWSHSKHMPRKSLANTAPELVGLESAALVDRKKSPVVDAINEPKDGPPIYPHMHERKAGRRSHWKPLVKPELDARIKDNRNPIENSINGQARVLQEWFVSKHPTLKCPAFSTFRNNLREDESFRKKLEATQQQDGN